MAVFWFDQFSLTNRLEINSVGKTGSKRTDEAVVILTSEFF